ncbi:SsgA family sporulation/cell division regulator [Kitasatospora sp. NPDC006697]|uniref:SsgA family sporulation/cell division regulator n=1 Tax=Kitasatospora sp. NPDC006697 TaxID=3364020 RepID=UPI0036A2454D
MPAQHSVSSPRPRPEGTSTEIHLDARIILSEDQALDIPVRFGYRGDDPFAVALEFLGPAAAAGTWRFSRELLRDGLRKPAGLGDVRIWPPCPCHGRPHLRVMLKGSDGSILLDLPTRQVRRWLRRESYALVPHGTEGNAIDWDTELHGLTS